jgi:hypothetical protein
MGMTEQAAIGSRARLQVLTVLALLAILLSLPLFGLAWQQRKQLDGPVRDAKLQLAGSYLAACDVIEGDTGRGCSCAAATRR